jgi:hypothetical protein
MPTPIEAYRQGYERGRNDSTGGRLAETTMGMLRDDPGGHFQKGYTDGAAGRPFNAPSIPSPKTLKTSGLIPKFSENPMGWLLGVLIVVEFWALWQLVKAPFELIAPLTRGEKPSPWVIVKSVIVAGLVIVLVWWVPHVNEMPSPGANPGAASPAQSAALSGSANSVSVTAPLAPGVPPQTSPVTQPPIVSAPPPAPFPPRINWLSHDYECRKIVSIVHFDQDEQGNYDMTAYRKCSPSACELGRTRLTNSNGKYLAEYVMPNEILRLELTYQSSPAGIGDKIRLEINSTEPITNNPIAERSRICVLETNGSY